MFKRLTFDVTFSTGRRVSGDHCFEPGLTAITGRNWTGKSLRLELVRYALFGSEALRGKADDYQDLDVGLEFEVGGQPYWVKRCKRSVAVWRTGVDDQMLATGHRAVNSKVTEILGFGLDVFDIACNCGQGEVERLGAMTPAERKRMVDSTIGLGALDEVAKVLAGEASELRQRAAGIREGASDPEEPVRSVDYAPSAQLAPVVEALREDVRRLVQARAFLAVPAREPVEPERPCEESVEELEVHQARRSWIERQIAEAGGALKGLPPLPDLTPAELDEAEAAIDLHYRWKARERLRERECHLRSVGLNICPSCHHEWPLEADALSRVRQELEAFADVPGKVDPPRLTIREVEKARRAYEVQGRRKDLEAELVGLRAALEVTPDRSRDLRAMLAYEPALARYAEDLTEYRKWKEKELEATVSVANLGPWAEDHLRRGEEQLREAQVYERLLASYQLAASKYQASITLAEQLEHDAAQLALARKALAELRLRVKQQFTPLLAKAASTLVQRMSGGAYSRVEIDDDFEITLDGQALRTLSGAGKAIANLAVRLGLGMVLTRGVLPVLLADEVDAAMDSENAAATATCIRGLADSLRQVILVSHKRHEADHYVEL